jgi:ribosomal protein L40E
MVNIEQKRFVNSREKNCPFCGALNPPMAYACTKCFKVMKDFYKPPWWLMKVHISIAVFVVLLSLGIAGTLVMWSWSRAAEAKAVILEQQAIYEMSLAKVRDRERQAEDQSSDQSSTSETQ